MELKRAMPDMMRLSIGLLIVPYGIETGLGWIQAGC